MSNTIEQTPAEQAVSTATEALEISRRHLAEARAQNGADHADHAGFAEQVVALAFQLGRMQGRAEAAQERFAEMTAKAAGTDTP